MPPHTFALICVNICPILCFPIDIKFIKIIIKTNYRRLKLRNYNDKKLYQSILAHSAVSLAHSQIIFAIRLPQIWIFLSAQKLVNDVNRFNIKLVLKVVFHRLEQLLVVVDELVFVQAIEVLVPSQSSEAKLV